MERKELEYVTFWPRVVATVIDFFLFGVPTCIALTAYYGESYWDEDAPMIQGPMDFLLSWILPAIITISFWQVLYATPGKLVIGARIVDSNSGLEPSFGQFLGRYFACYLSAIPMGLGFLWVAISSSSQGWHDMLAGTVVVRPKERAPRPVTFD